MKTKNLKINSDFVAGYKKGDIVSIYVDGLDTPISPFWRQRLRDAKRDNCCEFIKEKETKKGVKNHEHRSS